MFTGKRLSSSLGVMNGRRHEDNGARTMQQRVESHHLQEAKASRLGETDQTGKDE